MMVSCWSGEFPAAHEVEHRCMPVVSGRENRAMNRVMQVVDQQFSREIRHRAARFVHQKVWSGKVPIVRICTRQRPIDLSARNTR